MTIFCIPCGGRFCLDIAAIPRIIAPTFEPAVSGLRCIAPSKNDKAELAKAPKPCLHFDMSSQKARFVVKLVFLTGLSLADLVSPCVAQVTASPTPATKAPAPNSAPPAPGLLNQKYFVGDFLGERPKLEDEGFTFTPIYTAETFGNPIGGVKQGVIYEGLLDLELTLDFKKMTDW